MPRLMQPKTAMTSNTIVFVVVYIFLRRNRNKCGPIAAMILLNHVCMLNIVEYIVMNGKYMPVLF